MSSCDPRMSRRHFLRGLGVASGAVVASTSGLAAWVMGSRPTEAAALAAGDLSARSDRTLVVLELGGGNDALSTVIPYSDPAYRALRPTLAVADPIALDDEVALHPNLARLAARYRDGQVAIVEGVGTPNPNLSHFASLARWWSGDPADSTGSGWLGRYLDGTVGDDDPLAGVGIGPMPSPALMGTRSFATSIADATGLQPSLPAWAGPVEPLLQAWAGFAPRHPDRSTLLGQVQRAIALTARARHELADALAADAGQGGAGATGAGAANEPRSYRQSATITSSLQLAASLVAADEPPRVVYVSGVGDFDTHQGQAQRHPALMADLDAGIEGFFTTLDAAGASQRALLMTVSEFGRRAAENGSGTDHGAASTHLFVGPGVKGGRYGVPPSLTKLDEDGNLAVGVDYRVLYATALEGWLGTESDAILGKGFTPLPILA